MTTNGQVKMKYAFYPGCVSRGGCPELYEAVMKVAEKLGFELKHDVLEERGVHRRRGVEQGGVRPHQRTYFRYG